MKLLKILFLMILVCSAHYPTARADIVWSGEQDLYVDGVPSWYPAGSRKALDLDIDENGTVDYRAGYTNPYEIYSFYIESQEMNKTTGAWIGSLGAMIDNTLSYETDDAWLGTWMEVTRSGPWMDESGYMGLCFSSSNGTHYGWLHMTVGPLYSMNIHSWAYNTVPDEGIVAGAIPEPSSVVLLLVGGTGIWMARKRRTRPDNTSTRQKALDRYV